MGLGLSDAQKNYIGPVIWLARITDPQGVVRYYGEDFMLVDGNYHNPYLVVTSGPTMNRSLAADSAEIVLLNADLAVGNLMTVQDWEGCPCILLEYLVGLNSTVEHFRGMLSDAQQTDDGVKFRVLGELDAAQIDAQERIYSTDCTLRFAKPACGYDGSQSVVTELLGERTADIFSNVTVGDSTLAMTVDEHKNRYVVITHGTGIGQKRRVLTNSATTIEVVNRFSVVPDGTSKFKVFTFSDGAPKFLFTPTTSLYESGQDISTVRTIGASGLNMTVNSHAGDTVVQLSFGGFEISRRKIGSNTATTITIDPSEPDMGVGPDHFRVIFRACPKDFAQSCEIRARAHRFNGFPLLDASLFLSLAQPDTSLLYANYGDQNGDQGY